MKSAIWLCLALAPALAASARATTDEYAAIDAHALQTPAAETESVERLAAYLTRPAKTDREKARIIFRWIAQNIDYDVESFLTQQKGPVTPDSVLRQRKSVCAGYANLFEALSRAAGLEVATIPGFARGFGFRAGSLTGDTNHDWNAVKLDGRWHLLDSTWGTGHMDEQKRYVREFDNYFFLTPPDQFIYRHLPKQSKWQLLPRPLTADEFSNLVYLRTAFSTCNLTLLSHSNAVIKAADNIIVTLGAPADVALSAKLDRNGAVVSDATFCQREGEAFAVHVAWPAPGIYNLRIFARRMDKNSLKSKAAADYRVEATGGVAISFPKQYGAFDELNVQLLEPLTARLRAGAVVRFRLRVPGADKAAVVINDEWTMLARDGDTFSGEMTVPAGPVDVFTHPANSQEESFSALVSYTAE